MPRPRPALLLCLALVGCSQAKDDTNGFQSTGSGPSSFDDPSTGTPTTGTPTTSDTPTTTDAPTTTDVATTTPAETTGEPTSSTTDATTGDLPPACGDGTLDPGEQCDDGNGSDGDFCLSDCTIGLAIVAVVGRADDPAAIATYTPATGWSVVPANYDVAAADVVSIPFGAMAVVRRAGAVPDAQDELWFARWNSHEPELLQTAAKVGEFGFTLHAPSIASVPDTVTLAFLGTDFKHYTALWSDDAWAPFIPLPASMLDVQAFGPSGATLAPSDQLATWAAYAGDDDKIYVARKPQWDAAWEASIQAPPPAVVDTIRPTAIVEPNGDLVLAYVRKADNRIGLTRRSLADNTWSLEVQVDPQARTAAPFALLQTDAGAWLVAWQNLENPGIAFAAGAAFDAWDAPVTLEIPADSTPPRLVLGSLGADAELLWTAGGLLRHARISSGAAEPANDVPDIAGATSVAAARVQREP